MKWILEREKIKKFISIILQELQTEMTKSFIERTRNLERPCDMGKITQAFFWISKGAERLHERLMCNGVANIAASK